VLRWLREVASANPRCERAIVMYGRGLALVVSGRSALTDDVTQARARPHVAFKVCEIARRNQKRNSSRTTGHFGRSDGSTNT
jgi:hypothetical protein